jgi:hypothetical protein
MDKVRNIKIQGIITADDKPDITHTTENKQYGHTQEVTYERLPKIIMNWAPTGK